MLLSLFPFQDLCSQLLEVVSVAPLGVQREIITSLPEILEDAQHNDTAKELKWGEMVKIIYREVQECMKTYKNINMSSGWGKKKFKWNYSF